MLDITLAKQHLEYEDDDRDTLIQQYIDASTAWIEQFTGKLLTVGEVVEMLPSFGTYIRPSRAPFVSLTSIEYVDTDDTPQTLTGTRVQAGRIYAPVSGWPSLADYSPVTLTYQAGYETTPADLISAQLLLVGHWFQSREAANVGNITTEVPFAVEALLRPYRELLV